MPDRTYIAIDLKSFYASVECMDRNLDPMTTNLVVADESRTEKTICLAVSPSLKAHGIPGRARLFEVIQRVRAVNAERRHRAPRGQFSGKSANAPDLQANPALELGYVVAVPRMARYMEVSAKIYSVYLKYVSPDDIHVYSIDEVFIDATSYLKLYKLTAREFAMKMIRDVLQTYLGPKKALKWMEETHPEAFAYYKKSLQSFSIDSLKDWIVCVKNANKK